jgi:hypothetical protein
MIAGSNRREFTTLLGFAAAFNQPSVLVLSVVLVCTISSKADESYGAPPPSMATHLNQLVRPNRCLAGIAQKKFPTRRRDGFDKDAINTGT